MKIVIAVQSSTTGRFLLKEKEGVWNWPHEALVNSKIAMLFEGLKDLTDITGVDSEKFVLDHLPGFASYQLFYILVSGEPKLSNDLDWFALYDFPEKVSDLIIKIVEWKPFIEKSFQPAI